MVGRKTSLQKQTLYEKTFEPIPQIKDTTTDILDMRKKREKTRLRAKQ